MDDVFYPQEIEDNAFAHIESSGNDNIDKSYSTEIYKPLTEVDRNYPSKVIAHETISTTLDTRIKKIKGEYTFNKEGAIIVGGYVAGVSGEIAISPDGITGKNVNGETTFAIDGTSGDAVFKGEIKSGSVVSEGDVTISGQGAFIVNDGTYDRIIIGYQSGGF